MAVIARLDMDIETIPASTPSVHAARVDTIDCYALADTDLAQYAGLIVPRSVDQEHLARHRDIIGEYLQGGGVVVFGGHLHRNWLPGASMFVPVSEPSRRAYQVEYIAEHPVFAGLTPDDLTLRRGVAGFFARGHHPPPEGAEILIRLTDGVPATYVDRVSTNGTILVHATSDLLNYHAALGDQLLSWIVSESQRTKARRNTVGTPTGQEQSVTSAPQKRSLGTPTGNRPEGLASLYDGGSSHHRVLTTDKYARHLGDEVYLPDLADTDLTGCAGLIIPERMHRGLLNRGAGRILDLLDAGGTVFVFTGGEPLPDFLPNVRFEFRPTNFWWWLEPGASLDLHAPNPDHALFGYLGLRDCTWHYHGVLDPPDGAEVLLTLPSGEALLYVDGESTAGTMVVCTLDPISHFGAHFMPAAERFLDGFLPWAAGAVA